MLPLQQSSMAKEWHQPKGIHTRNDISRFSPPQMSMPLSYCPSSLKYSLSIANKPPAIVGDLKKKRAPFEIGPNQRGEGGRGKSRGA